MSRRSRFPKGPFRGHLDPLYQEVRVMMARLTSRDRLILSYEEFLRAFVPRPLHECYMEVSQIAKRDRYANTFTLPWAQPQPTKAGGVFILEVQLHKLDGVKPPLIPDPVNYFGGDDPELHERITSWVTRRWEVGASFGRVKKLLNILDERCIHPAHVRYYWPPILTLAARNDAFSSLLHNMGTKAGSPPPLPPAVRELCRAAGATITAASLVEEIAPDPERIPIEITFTDYNYTGRNLDDPDLGGIPVL